jgi:alpha-1,2-mannosyltransferase
MTPLTAARAVPGRQWPLLSYLAELNRLPRKQRIVRALVIAATLGCALMVLLTFVIAPLTGHFTGQFEDFNPILYAGRAASSGADPYGLFYPQVKTTLIMHLAFDYLPLIAVLARPLAALPYHVAATLWLWLLLACTIGASVLVARTTLPTGWPRSAIGFCAIVLFAPTTYNLWHGQMNALVLLSLAVALRAWVRGDQVTCGLALGLGGIAKVAPLALLLLLLRRRWWRGFATGAVTVGASLLVSGLFLGFQRVGEWFTDVLPYLGRADGSYLNQSIGALLSRIFDHDVWRLDAAMPALQVTITLVSAAGVLAAAWLVRPGQASPERRSLEFATAVVAMVLAGAIAWWSDYGSLALTLLVLTGLAARGLVRRPVIIAGALLFVGAGLVAAAFFGFGGEGWVPSTFGTPWWTPALQIDSLPADTAVILLVTLLVTLARHPDEPRGPVPPLEAAAD